MNTMKKLDRIDFNPDGWEKNYDGLTFSDYRNTNSKYLHMTIYMDNEISIRHNGFEIFRGIVYLQEEFDIIQMCIMRKYAKRQFPEDQQ